MEKKIGFLILVVIISIVLASFYGSTQNLFSFSISDEYFTEYKFKQFDLWEDGYGDLEFKIVLIGILSTWWFGLIIGSMNGLIGITQKTTKLMIKGVIGATIRTLLFTFLFGLLGLWAGFTTLKLLPIEWDFPPNLGAPSSFLAVGSMHTLSYLGAIIGLIYGVNYQLKLKKPVPNKV